MKAEHSEAKVVSQLVFIQSTGFAREREPFYLLIPFVSAPFTKSRTLSIQSLG
jgi:hypothetical protein